MMEQIVEQDRFKRDSLKDLYHDILSICKEYVKGKIKEEVEEDVMFKEFEKTLPQHIQDLMEEECPIVITGETSAGKSTLLNVLIGHEVLPSSVLPTTLAVCCVKYGEEREVKVVCKDGSLKSYKYESDEDTRKGLKDLFKEKDSSLKSVDVCLPLSVLKGVITFVDTPGFGDKGEINQVLFEYLPKAIACIYVLKTDNAGGVQADRLPQIWQHQAEYLQENQTELKSDLMIFVCNKWDQIPSDEEEEVYAAVNEKLKKEWSKVQKGKDKSLNVMKLSAKEELYKMKKEEDSDRFKELMNKITYVVPGCLKERIERHFKFVLELLKKIQECVKSHIESSGKNLKEMKAKEEEMKTLLENMRRKVANATVELQHFLIGEFKKLACEQIKYLCSEDVKNRILQKFEGKDFSDYTSFDDLEQECLKMMEQCLEDEVKDWGIKNHVEERWEHVKEKFFEEVKDVEMAYAEVIEKCNSDEKIKADNRDVQQKDKATFSTGEKAMLVATIPLTAPIAVVSAIFAVPIQVGFLISEKIESNRKFREFNSDRQRYLSECLDRILDPEIGKYTEDNIFEYFRQTYITPYFQKLDKLENDINSGLLEEEKRFEILSSNIHEISLERDRLRKMQEEISKLLKNLENFKESFLDSNGK